VRSTPGPKRAKSDTSHIRQDVGGEVA
jgi:hypothetical protein